MRDIRDPKSLGETLLRVRKKTPKFTLSQTADAFKSELRDIKPYEGFLMGHYTADRYKKELASRDDIYAKSTLEGINTGIKPKEDPSGN